MLYTCSPSKTRLLKPNVLRTHSKQHKAFTPTAKFVYLIYFCKSNLNKRIIILEKIIALIYPIINEFMTFRIYRH